MSEKLTPHAQRLAKLCPDCLERRDCPDPSDPLIKNAQYERFCIHIAINKKDNVDAYLECGPKTKNRGTASMMAKRWLTRLDVQNRIKYLLDLNLEHDLKTQEWVDDGLRQVYERCMDKVPVPNEAGKWKFNSQGANAALLTMARARGMLVEKIELTGIEKELKDMKPDEVLDYIKAAFLGLTNSRDLLRQWGEESGLEFADSESGSATEVPPGDAVPTLQ
jgi:hypothetical protein